MNLSDRVAVMYGGESYGRSRSKYTDIEEIGLMMAGSKYKINKILN